MTLFMLKDSAELRYYHPKANHIRLLQLYSLLKVLAQAATAAQSRGIGLLRKVPANKIHLAVDIRKNVCKIDKTRMIRQLEGGVKL